MRRGCENLMKEIRSLDRDLSQKAGGLMDEKEQKLINIMRSLDYGELHIKVKSGLPVHVEEIKKSIKL